MKQTGGEDHKHDEKHLFASSAEEFWMPGLENCNKAFKFPVYYLLNNPSFGSFFFNR